MEDISVFQDKEIVPNEKILAQSIGKTFARWSAIQEYVYSQYPDAKADWNYPGSKYGWNF